MKKAIALATVLVSTNFVAIASEDSQVQDMSDPLAVYTQLGGGITDRGLNFKMGQTFDTGSETTMGMNVLEIKGALGETLGFRDDANDSVDSMRFRRFQADMTNGRGMQIDANYDFNAEAGSLSYSFIQALPKFGPVQFYPLAGVGVAFANNALGDNGEVISGYSVPGTFGLVGTYTKIEITDKIWLNYNPMWMTTLSGSTLYTEAGFNGESSVLAHEVAASYQFTPRFNVRYFANWTEYSQFKDGEHRIEFNYQI
ncbi:hypothetical protein [Vibrio hangzhouensis]|uniref:Outer membrane protein beta-barrel domain-containing protein n=1 Tax=Vibrio hangzhouensis TaxID=462991 RepID=A0A1H6A786_9VIBR|nr:hypothetical protein [Vibrio hangzhouensis]SEG44232.1 hypothetical protein SAMN04488244_11457 [Vibrio hangzhouensis]